MKRLIAQRYLLRQNLLAIIGISLSFYFCYHMIAGERSYLRYLSLERQIVQAQNYQEDLGARRAQLARRVSMMRPATLDKDLLEERVRDVLGYYYADEGLL